MNRSLSIPVLATLLGLVSGCHGSVFGPRTVPGQDQETLTKLEANQSANEKLPEIVTLPPPAPQPLVPVAAPPQPAAARPATLATRTPEPYEDEVALPRRPAPTKSKSKAVSSVPGAHPKSYKVQPGDTLQKISMKMYGTTKKWDKIFEANKTKMKKADVVVVGTVLTIP